MIREFHPDLPVSQLVKVRATVSTARE